MTDAQDNTILSQGHKTLQNKTKSHQANVNRELLGVSEKELEVKDRWFREYSVYKCIQGNISGRAVGDRDGTEF